MNHFRVMKTTSNCAWLPSLMGTRQPSRPVYDVYTLTTISIPTLAHDQVLTISLLVLICTRTHTHTHTRSVSTHAVLRFRMEYLKHPCKVNISQLCYLNVITIKSQCWFVSHNNTCTSFSVCRMCSGISLPPLHKPEPCGFR